MLQSMKNCYRDYFWKEGIPYGLEPLNSEGQEKECYKIVMDPYRKRISIEKYSNTHFINTIYDSALLNFRHLNQIEQQSWQKIPMKENDQTMECLIRDQDDRVLFLETYSFEQNLCVQCVARSPQNIILSIQKMHYTYLGDEKNEVILYDINHHPVIQKLYEANPLTGEFTALIEENRNMQGVHFGKN